ncbi:MAG: WD40/YVTN/BNR-like repeat-containing protein [Anaerolineales bacterium]
MKSLSRFVLFSLPILLLVMGMVTPAYSQDGPFEDTFDNPDLPGWQHTPNVYVTDGFLRVEPGGFASPEGKWGAFELIIRARYTGLGEMAILYNLSEAGASILLFNGSRFQLQREIGGQVENVGEPIRFDTPEGEWFDLTFWVTPDEQLVLIGGEPAFSAPVAGVLSAGGFGFETMGDFVLDVDNFLLMPQEGHPVEEHPSDNADEAPASDDGEENSLPTSTLTWIRLGGPPGGLGYDIRYKFDDHDTWYVTDAKSGVHISTDDGLTWQHSNTGIDTASGASGDSIPIFSLTVDPHDPEIIWVGTDLNGRIYKSTDGGLTWESKDQGVIHEHEILLSFRGFTVDPRSSNIVYAMGELQLIGNNVWGPGVGGVVYKTTNGGDSWTRIWHGEIPSSLARYMWINPQNPDILYVSTGIFDRGAVGEGDPGIDVDPFGGLGILKSTDGGKTWDVLGKENGLEFLYIGSLFMHPEDPDVLLAAAGHIAPDEAINQWTMDGRSPMGVYRTSDGGETWTQVLAAEEEAIGQAFSAVDICPSDPDIVYAGSDAAVYRSDDSGLTWEKTAGGFNGWGPPGIPAGWPIDLQCDPEDTNRVFSNNYGGGNFLSEDGGVTWVNASTGYSGAQLISLAVDPFNPARVFVGGRSGGWYSEDGGLTWNGIRNPGEEIARAGSEAGGVAIDPSRPNHILIGTLESILEWGTGDPVWQSSAYTPDYGPSTSVIEYAPSDANVVYAGSAGHNTMVHAEGYEGGRGVLVSRDGGSNWEIITGEAFKDAMVTDLAIDPTDAKVLYVATRDGLFFTRDGGGSWEKNDSLPQDVSVRTIAVDPADSQSLIAGVQLLGLYISSDGGSSWRQVSAGLEPNGNHRDIVFDAAHPGVVYTSDISSGVYRSDDGGKTWLKLSEGLTSRAATGLSLSADGNHLYAATSGGGVFRLDLNGKPPISTGVTLFGEVPDILDEAKEGEEGETESDDQSMDANETSQEGSKTKSGLSLPCLGGALPLLLFAVSALARTAYKRKIKL